VTDNSLDYFIVLINSNWNLVFVHIAGNDSRNVGLVWLLFTNLLVLIHMAS
jgi:hypothetical protein